jgi:predicted dehydrogenase
MTAPPPGTARRTVRIAMNGVTGRMGYRQHLVGSILAIRERGGVPLAGGEVVWPEPVLVGTDAGKLAAIAQRHDLAEWTTSLDEALADTHVYFDAQTTQVRAAAIAAGKHVHAEKRPRCAHWPTGTPGATTS